MARRQAARKEAGRGRIRRALLNTAKLMTLLVAAGAIGAAVRWVMDPANLPVASVHIRGTFAHVEHETLQRAIEPFIAAGFLWLDMEGIRRELEGLAWVRSSSVRRAWPATLEVSVEEQQPAAIWAAGGLVNPSGERFVPRKAVQPNGLPTLSGPEGTAKKLMTRYREMQGMLAALDVAIVRLEMDARRAWRVALDNGLELRLGRRDVEGRLLRFVRAYAKAIAPRLEAIDNVDLRYTNGFAVKWKPGRAA